MQNESQNIEYKESWRDEWDDIPVYGATLDDIDRNAIDYFLQCSIKAGRMDESEVNSSTEDVLRNLGLFTREGELKNAAILLFGKHVGQFFPSAVFKIGRFHTDESDLIIQDVVEGNLIQMASQVMEVLRTKYLLSPIHYEGLQRIEQLEIPDKALRELIYNAISHKAYNGPAIQMRIYDRSIELWNYGLLPKELTPATLLQKHSSYPRNHNIANVFYKAGFVESWGRGFKKIAEEFERANLPLPTIEENGGGVMAIVQRKTIDEVIAERGEDVGVNVGDGGNGGGNETYLSSATYSVFYCKILRHYRQTNGGNVGNPSTHHRTRTFYITKVRYDLSCWCSAYRKMETVKTD